MGLQGIDRKIQKRIEELKILIVDDQPEVRALVRNILVEVGVTRTFEATNGKEALQFLDTDFETVNMIVCDWNMPSMTGIELLKQIRSVFPDMPFMMITGKSDKNAVLEAKMSGVSAFIRKPFSPEQFETKLRILAGERD